MELDKRITDISKIMNCFTVEDAKRYLHTYGYFADYIEDFCNLNEIDMFELTGIEQEFKYPYCVDGNSFKLFLPCAFVADEKEKKEKKYRPFKDLEEFRRILGKGVGNIIHYREKGSSLEFKLMWTGYSSEEKVLFSCFHYNLTALFERYEYCDSDGEWLPFGVEVEDK